MVFRQIAFFIRGVVYFRAYDGFSERFLELCAKRGLRLFSLKPEENGVFAAVKKTDYALLLETAGAAGMQLTVLKKRGMPYLMRRYRRRIGIPLGGLLAVVLVAVLSGFVWSIEISGTDSVRAQRILRLLEEDDIRKGCFVSQVRVHDLRDKIEASDARISHATVDLAGSRLYIFITEREDTPIEIDRGGYTDVVAAKAGRITAVRPLIGEAAVSVGQEVQPGMLLISGMKTNKYGETYPVNAKGEVLAQTETSLSSSAPLRFSASRAASAKNRYALRFFGLVLPFVSGAQSQTAFYLSTRQTVFPLGVIRFHTAEYEEGEIRLGEKQARLLAFSDLCGAAFWRLNGKKLLSAEITQAVSEQGLTLDAVFLCEEDIARLQPLVRLYETNR